MNEHILAHVNVNPSFIIRQSKTFSSSIIVIENVSSQNILQLKSIDLYTYPPGLEAINSECSWYFHRYNSNAVRSYGRQLEISQTMSFPQFAWIFFNFKQL